MALIPYPRVATCVKTYDTHSPCVLVCVQGHSFLWAFILATDIVFVKCQPLAKVPIGMSLVSTQKRLYSVTWEQEKSLFSAAQMAACETRSNEYINHCLILSTSFQNSKLIQKLQLISLHDNQSTEHSLVFHIFNKTTTRNHIWKNQIWGYPLNS